MKAKYLDWLANAQKISVAKLIGNNRKFIECVKMATITANAISPLLICGETGTGKELFAQIVHYEGGRANKPFGTVKGAFTGAAD
jgi:transcriptional regulator with PAS, ATPase and Fis domain